MDKDIKDILKDVHFGSHLKTRGGYHVIVNAVVRGHLIGMMNNQGDTIGEYSGSCELYHWDVKTGECMGKRGYWNSGHTPWFDIVDVWDEATYTQNDLDREYNRGKHECLTAVKSLINGFKLKPND